MAEQGQDPAGCLWYRRIAKHRLNRKRAILLEALRHQVGAALQGLTLPEKPSL